MMPSASSSRVAAKVVKIRVGVKRLDQGREHPVRNIDDELDVVGFQARAHDLVPGGCSVVLSVMA